MDLIDVHSHIVPARFPDNPSPATNSRWPCMHAKNASDATVMIADKPFREIDSRSWDVARRIEDMDRDRRHDAGAVADAGAAVVLVHAV